jgi:high-affinity iron transporter
MALQRARDITSTDLRMLQVWMGTGLGLLICFVIGCGLIGAFYGIGIDGWGAVEEVWEGVFSLIACIIITLMGAALLRVSKLQEKWRVKLARLLAAKDASSSLPPATTGSRIKRFLEKYAMFMLPFITVLREGLEAVVFVGGVSLGVPASAIPLAAFLGLLAGTLVGVLIYK